MENKNVENGMLGFVEVEGNGEGNGDVEINDLRPDRQKIYRKQLKCSSKIWAFDKKERMRLLRLLVLPFELKYVSSEKYKLLDGLPVKLRNELIKLCELYNTEIRFEKVWKLYLNGCYNYDKKLIKIYYTNIVSTYHIATVLAHELAHVIQYKLYGRAKDVIVGYGCFLSTQLEFEWEACELAYYIYKKYFSELWVLKKKDFMAYRSEDEKFALVKKRGLI